MPGPDPHPTQALIHLDNLTHNLALLGELAGGVPLWPAIKANAYGHGAKLVAEHLTRLGHDTLCVAHVKEAVELLEAGIPATFLILSAALPEHAEAVAAHGCEPAVCTRESVEAMSRAARDASREVAVHVKVDTGMGRVGVQPHEARAFIEHCQSLPGIRVRGLMSHFPRADEADKGYSLAQLARFQEVVAATRDLDIEVRHLANSAGILDVPGSSFDAVRPGIAIYGLEPSSTMVNARAKELRPVLEWRTRVTFLKEVPRGTGLSYGHAFHTPRRSLIATVPVGYGDGLSRALSNRCHFLVRGVPCPQVARITMDQTLVDVTELRGQVGLGDDVTIIGRQGDCAVGAMTLADTLDTISYEIVTAISARVPRVAV